MAQTLLQLLMERRESGQGRVREDNRKEQKEVHENRDRGKQIAGVPGGEWEGLLVNISIGEEEKESNVYMKKFRSKDEMM